MEEWNKVKWNFTLKQSFSSGENLLNVKSISYNGCMNAMNSNRHSILQLKQINVNNDALCTFLRPEKWFPGFLLFLGFLVRRTNMVYWNSKE